MTNSALRFLLVLVSLSISGVAAAADEAKQTPPPDKSASVSEPAPAKDDLTQQLEQVLEAPAPASSPAAQSRAPSGPGNQSMNPDVSVILDATGGFQRHALMRLAGDDPDLGGALHLHGGGVNLQEAEVAFQSVIDPYLRADVFLTIPNLGGIEVEEAYVTSTGLPGGLQIKAGVFRSAIGRQNGQHLHVQDFTLRPLINAAYLGDDGLRPAGIQISWLVPVPFYLLLFGEAFSVAPPDNTNAFSSFGGGNRADLTYTAGIKTFAPLSESVSLAVGIGGLSGLTAGVSRAEVASQANLAGATSVLFADRHTLVGSGDIYLKWKPTNVAGGYYSLAWQTEYFVRRTGADTTNTLGAQIDGGIYSQLVFQFARRWFLGVRFDALGLPASTIQGRQTRESASLTLAPSEFSRIRLYGEHEDPGAQSTTASGSNYAAMLQLEVAMGAHGAHAF